MKSSSELAPLNRVFFCTSGAWGSCVFVAFLALGCADEEPPRATWTPLSEEDVVTALGSPTGEFRDVPDAAVLSEIESRLPGIVEAARFVGHMATVVENASDEDLESQESELPEVVEAPETNEDTAWATNLYLRIACPGKSIDPPFSFEHGEVRLESPELSGLDFSALTQEGQFLLSFSKCEVGSIKLDSQFAGRYFVDTSSLVSPSGLSAAEKPKHALAINAQTENAESSLGVLGVACGSSTRSCSDLIRVAAEIDAGTQGTYVVAFELTRAHWSTPGSLSLTVRGASSESTCEATAGSNPTVSCMSE